ncbi:MAG: hypothetical protein H7841_14610 [Magnetospirillum sp. WYHS-4]
MNSADWLAIFIAIVSAVGLFVGWHSAGEKARKILKEWMDQNAKAEVAALVDQAKRDLHDQLAEARALMEELRRHRDNTWLTVVEIQAFRDRLDGSEIPKLSPEQERDVRTSATAAAQKPDAEREYSDWIYLALEAEGLDRFADAANYYKKAAMDPEIDSISVRRALFNQAWAHGKNGTYKAAISVYKDLIDRFGDASEPALHEWVAKALVNMGVAVGKTEGPQAAIDVYRRAIDRFGSATEPALREQVARARNNKGSQLFHLAKKAWQASGQNDDARKKLAEALAEVEAALVVLPDNSIYLGNKAYILFLLDRRQEAEAPLREALKLGGDARRQARLKESAIDPVPPDEDFTALVDRLWDELHPPPA